MFPNVYVALRLFLTLPVSNCEGERAFSLLSRIKNELRSEDENVTKTPQGTFSHESDLTIALEFYDIVEDFARNRARKKGIS